MYGGVVMASKPIRRKPAGNTSWFPTYGLATGQYSNRLKM